ncbi:tripartite motif-containing protein 16-like [Neoarius graeffei]|uniref:tripartite motif-containing protein 16-like n=1 Tax=Neoarius graeffei TaxID=443677 RepID=UPI00298C7BCC|nr:tripartite motif-containing protein 16-like [Neoarius graeffei]
MAKVDQDELICTFCLELLKDPMVLPCDHSFCKECISGHLEKEDQMGSYSCPHCRYTFTSWPILRRNNRLAELVEKRKKTKSKAASPAYSYAGPRDVACDYCIERKLKAVKSCLICVASFCETHLKPHSQSPALKKHTLIEVSAKLQDMICSQHNKLIDIFCRTDQTCICCLCMLDNHKGHITVSAVSERTEKMNELKENQKQFQKIIQEKQSKMQELKQAMNSLKLSAQTAVEDNERIFNELISCMEKKRSELKELIRAKEEAEQSQAERLLEQLEQEIADLQKKVTELEQLSHTKDHIQFIQEALATGRRSPSGDRPNFNTSSIDVHQHPSFNHMRKSLSALKERVEEFFENEFNKIPPRVAALKLIAPAEPQTRKDFLKYFCYLTLDPNTAHRNLILRENNRAVMRSDKEQLYSAHPERFDYWWQVLCKESLCGRCYWEVEWSSGGVEITLSYKDIIRKGDSNESVFGNNPRSWSFMYSSSSSSVSYFHNSIKTVFKVPSLSKIGVYVDHSRGTLSFHNVSDRMTVLHKIHTTFTQPLYAGFGPQWWSNSTVRLSEQKSYDYCSTYESNYYSQ